MKGTAVRRDGRQLVPGGFGDLGTKQKRSVRYAREKGCLSRNASAQVQ